MAYSPIEFYGIYFYVAFHLHLCNGFMTGTFFSEKQELARRFGLAFATLFPDLSQLGFHDFGILFGRGRGDLYCKRRDGRPLSVFRLIDGKPTFQPRPNGPLPDPERSMHLTQY
jgi:hypothetical protein